MGHFLSRSFVNERLRLQGTTSYRLVAATGYGNRINSDRVVEMLNNTRRGDMPALPLEYGIPSDLMTAEEIAALPELAESKISPHEILVWANRRRDPLPHYRLNSHTRRYSRAAALAWMRRKFA